MMRLDQVTVKISIDDDRWRTTPIDLFRL